ncbi:DUF5312 family protein [Gracilinema caldarium]|uniref:DUF5312 family protein n=1 Tax=Gracilinema caldarium TaxID=215591 RepID=UPI0026EFBE29|nr:DUF5312 family protein [Gracilinema caldarium]
MESGIFYLGVPMAIEFLEKLLSLFTGGTDSESEKRRQLKQIARDLTKNKYKFYKVRGEEVLGVFAKLFYDIYKILSPAQVFLQNADKSNQLKQIVIEFFMDKGMLELQERLSEESIKERAKTTTIKELAQQLNNELTNFIAGFDGERSSAIDRCYNQILTFVQLVNFDYFFLLKKFDANLSERNFTYKPQFEPIRGEYISDDIKDFLEVLYALDFEQDWKPVFSVLKTYKGVEVVALDQWSKLLNVFRDLKRSGIFELMVRHIDKNPTWMPKPHIPNEYILDAYLQKTRTQVEVLIQQLVQERRNAKIDELAKLIFGTPAVSRLKNYTEKANAPFQKKMLGGFIHIQGLNYLKAFLLDFFKKDIRELCDLLLVRGQWSTNILSQQLSESYHELMAISEKLITFDDSLADDAEMGGRLRIAMAKADRDKEQLKYVRTLLKGINDEALKFITMSAQNLIVVGKNLKQILEDFQKSPHEIIINWKDIENSSEKPIDQRITEVYKVIYYFVQLMQFFVKQEQTPGDSA